VLSIVVLEIVSENPTTIAPLNPHKAEVDKSNSLVENFLGKEIIKVPRMHNPTKASSIGDKISLLIIRENIIVYTEYDENIVATMLTLPLV